eukprot:1196192-Prorocentrum_minimum.AAC.6
MPSPILLCWEEEHSGSIQGAFREHSGSIQGAFRADKHEQAHPNANVDYEQGTHVLRQETSFRPDRPVCCIPEHADTGMWIRYVDKVCGYGYVDKGVRQHVGAHHSQAVQTFREHSGNIQGTFREQGTHVLRQETAGGRSSQLPSS